MTAGPRQVPARRDERADGAVVVARHDGYAQPFGFLHERSLMLSADGNEILGADRLVPTSGKAGARDRFAIRFHLHPAIRATRTTGGDILLVAPDGEAWTFSCPMIEAELGESVYLSDVHGRRRAAQIVVAGRARVTPEVNWSFTRTALGQPQRAARGRNGQTGAGLFD
jgi:uncharacterized heparinase superfamily protein